MSRLCLRYLSKDVSILNSTRRELFDKEFLKQLESNKRRLEKINVTCKSLIGDVSLSMNKYISTPMDCARHVQEILVKNSALALVNDKPYDMYRPLTEDCTVKFLDYRSDSLHFVNMAFWRSCSFLTNWVLENCFHEDFKMNLCSFPKPDLHTGSFVCDVQLLYHGDSQFDPSILENIDLHAISNSARRIAYTPYEFVPLTVTVDVAENMFRNSPIKMQQLPAIVQRYRQLYSIDRVNLYKVGDHVDICQGPLISSTSQIGRFKITCVNPIETNDYGRLYRFQGVAIPTQLPTSHTTFDILAKRASLPNKSAPLPQLKIVSDIAAEAGRNVH